MVQGSHKNHDSIDSDDLEKLEEKAEELAEETMLTEYKILAVLLYEKYPITPVAEYFENEKQTIKTVDYKVRHSKEEWEEKIEKIKNTIEFVENHQR